MLFKTDDNEKTIIFPLAAIELGFIEYSIPQASCLQSELTVYIHTSRGRVQGNYSKSIQNIITDAKQIGVIR
ncbi:MAG: hypothetical protein WBF33_10375 [Candidatus Nitrosopolaris sp.]